MMIIETPDLIQQWLIARRAELLDAISICQSPLEQRLLLSLMLAWDGRIDVFAFIPGGGGNKPIAIGHGIELFAQREVGPYRADIAIEGVKKLAIEVDGHDFHDGDRAAAKRDKARDRYFAEQGWVTFRFTGSEIHRDPAPAVQQSLKFVGVDSMPFVPMPPKLVKRLAESPKEPDALLAALRLAVTVEEQNEILRQVQARVLSRLSAPLRRMAGGQ